MKNFHKNAIHVIKKTKINYFIGADSLVGLNEENLYKYSQNLKIYIYNFNFFKVIKLFFALLKYKIILKPKLEDKTLLLKLRYI